MSIGHFVRVYALVVGDGDVERTAADAFLAAETRKVNEKLITKSTNCCIRKAEKWHRRWQLIQQATSAGSTEVKRFLECEDLGINLKYDARAKVPKCCGTKIDSRSCISSDSNSGLLSDSSSCSSGSNDSSNFSDSNYSSSGDGSSSSGSSSSSSSSNSSSSSRSSSSSSRPKRQIERKDWTGAGSKHLRTKAQRYRSEMTSEEMRRKVDGAVSAEKREHDRKMREMTTKLKTAEREGAAAKDKNRRLEEASRVEAYVHQKKETRLANSVTDADAKRDQAMKDAKRG
jgi:hypothetical protein